MADEEGVVELFEEGGGDDGRILDLDKRGIRRVGAGRVGVGLGVVVSRLGGKVAPGKAAVQLGTIAVCVGVNAVGVAINTVGHDAICAIDVAIGVRSIAIGKLARANTALLVKQRRRDRDGLGVRWEKVLRHVFDEQTLALYSV